MTISSATKGRIFELRAAGLTMRAIAAEVGCSLSSVQTFLRNDYEQVKTEGAARTRLRHDRFRAKTNAIKLEAGCADCGYKDHPAALDFDHLPGTVKLFNVAQAAVKPWHDVLLEIAKCDVVCANCHRVRTFGRSRAQEVSKV